MSIRNRQTLVYRPTRVQQLRTFAALAAIAASGACAAEKDTPASVGMPCVADDESYATFSGFSRGEINVAETAACGAGSVCLVNHFQGRVSCAAGQDDGGQGCRTPAGEPVEVPVRPQLPARPPDQAVICSCRCDAPFAGDYCACPSGMRCEQLIVGSGDAVSRQFEGSYCVY